MTSTPVTASAELPTDLPAPTGIVLLHGWTNVRPIGHWQRLVAEAAATAGVQARYPQLPDTDEPVVSVWREEVLRELAGVPAGQRVLIAHSLACWTVLRIVAEYAAADLPFPADRVLLVGPPAREVMRTVEQLAPFEAAESDAELAAAIAASGAAFTIAVSDNDPYFPGDAVAWGESLGAEVAYFPNHRHFTIDDGYGPWPYSLAFALGVLAP
ncbi:alpha/beta fold hydrolase [Nakamurella silvestris]|nr:alpha/beta fold hydrolase [Nakamurella silvestris]